MTFAEILARINAAIPPGKCEECQIADGYAVADPIDEDDNGVLFEVHCRCTPCLVRVGMKGVNWIPMPVHLRRVVLGERGH